MLAFLHQFEIRYVPIMSLYRDAPDILAPYVAIAQRFSVENETNSNVKYTFYFEDYEIHITWDRMIFKSEGNISRLAENNSVIEQPFFTIFSKIAELPNFHRTKNCLFYVILVKKSEIKVEDIRQNFISSFINSQGLNEMLPALSDIGLALEKNNEDTDISVNIGPYVGAKDLRKRKLDPKSSDVKEFIDSTGGMAEIKYFNKKNKNVTYGDYKKILLETLKWAEIAWQKMKI